MKVGDKIITSQTAVSDLHESVRLLMRICRWAGFFPVEGLSDPSIGTLKFNLKCLYGIYHVLSIATLFLAALLTLSVLFTWEFSLGIVTSVMYCAIVFLNAAILSMLARKWSYLMKRSVYFERELAKVRTTVNISRKCNIISFTFLAMGFVERILFTSFVLDFVRRCMGESSITGLVFRNHIMTISPIVFTYLDYSFGSAVFSQMISLQSMFILNFMDVLIMVISYYLASYFRDINKLIEKQKNYKSTDWGSLRASYSKIVSMTCLYESYMSFALLLSLFVNLYFICLQLFNTFNLSKVGYDYCQSDETIYDAMHCPQYYMYYAYSFIYLVVRAFCMAYMAADVHFASQEPLYVMGEVHSSVYGIEIERFYRQITYTNIGMGGIFFNVTRQLILKIFATMITYELVMVQFAFMATKTNPVLFNGTGSSNYTV